MYRRPTESTRTYTLLPCTPLCRSIGRGAERLDRLEWTTGALEALRIETEVAKRLLRHLVALVGHRLDRLHVGLHRLDLLLHPSHLGRLDRPGGGELRGGESGPADQEKGGQRRHHLNRNANADAAQAFAVMEENITRFENVAELQNHYAVLRLNQICHHNPRDQKSGRHGHALSRP